MRAFFAENARPLDEGERLRGGAVWQLVGLITRRSQVQILPPLPISISQLIPGYSPGARSALVGLGLTTLAKVAGPNPAPLPTQSSQLIHRLGELAASDPAPATRVCTQSRSTTPAIGDIRRASVGNPRAPRDRDNEVNLMSRTRVLTQILLGSSVLLMAACASARPGALEEKYFQREAQSYLKFEKDGQTVYCQNEPVTASLIPHKSCITETALRQRVENYRRSRNAVARGGPPYVATTPGGS
jgi:hypothetical protein